MSLGPKRLSQAFARCLFFVEGKTFESLLKKQQILLLTKSLAKELYCTTRRIELLGE